MQTPTNEPTAALLGSEGPVARALGTQGGGYEERPQQLAMAGAVAEALSSRRHLVVEAGTGVGKSFAYLVPLLEWAARTETTVAVATSTIALQEQLVRHDLPLLAEALPFDVSFALVKGRANYVCLRRMFTAQAGTASLFEDEEATQLKAIVAWSSRTQDGSRQDLPFRPAPSVWEQVRAEQGNCKGRACLHYARCPYQESRRRAHTVRCLVLNHHVLMADLALRRSGGSFLPEVQALVVDEAHDLEDTAAEHLGLRTSSLGIAMLLGRLWQPKRRRGLLAAAGEERLRKDVERTRHVARAFFGALDDWAAGEGSGGDSVTLPAGLPVEDPLSMRLHELADGLERAGATGNAEDTVLELGARARQVRGAAEVLEALRFAREGEVSWLERGARGTITVASAPVAVGDLLKEVLWDEHDSVILTSATLATGNPPSFDFLTGRLGLRDAQTLQAGSPFDYTRQARVIVRDDLPDPVREAASYDAALPAAVRDAVRQSDGDAFVLFTGYGSMRRTVASVREHLEADGFRVLVQGEGLERPALLEAFREGGAVLFGVSSFWQGVDVPGDALRHVVIARLPFEVPTHPLQVARQARIQKAGRDPFRTLSLPTAALRLKQGFGRLIRRTSDKGWVTILDPRIATRSYGRYLLASLPDCPIEYAGRGA